MPDKPHEPLPVRSGGPRSIPALLAARRSGAPAIIYGNEVISYDALERRSRRAAGGLARLGVSAGDRVALWLPNTPAWLVLYFACAYLGAVAVAVNTRFRSTEVEEIVARSGAKVLALWPAFRNIDFAGILADVNRSALASLERVIRYDEGGAEAGTILPGIPSVDYHRLLAAAPYAGAAGGPESPCNLFTTSGTTRAPKLVLHQQSAIVGHALDVARGSGFDAAGAMLLQALPLCGVFGLCQSMAMLAAGRPAVVTPVFDAEASVRLVREHRVTFMNGTDEMVDRMLGAAGDDQPLATLRYFGYARFNPTLGALPARAAARGLRLRGLYGMSEVQAFYAMQPDGDDAHYDRPGGRVFSDAAAARARDPDSGRILPPGEPGELELRGPSLMVGYYRDPEATRAAFTADGYLRTGDLGYTVSDRQFVFVNRMGDVLRLGGFLVSPLEIEAHLETHPAVAGCVVVGARVPDGQAAVAFVTMQPGSGFDEPDLVAFCHRGLAGFKVPRRIYAVDEFPTTDSANGMKVQRGLLRETAEARLGHAPERA